MADRLQAAGATELQVSLNLANQPDVFDILMMAAVLNDQLRAAVTVERADLGKVGPKLDGAGLKRLVELHVSEFQFPDPDQHNSNLMTQARKRPKQPRHSGRNRVWQAKLLTENTGRYRRAGSFLGQTSSIRAAGEQCQATP